MTEKVDRIEKQVLLRAPVARVWRAVSDAGEFGTWFRAALDGAFAVGKRTTGRVTYPGYEHLRFQVLVERMEPERLLAFRWHPSPTDPKRDYAQEPTTLVELRLEPAPGGTLLTVVESGFDRLPADRRGEAFRDNERGWAMQLENVTRHVAG